MGYDLHITRAASWAEPAGAEIAAEEWLALAREDPEFELDPASGPYFAAWRGPGARREGWLDWSGGQLYTKDPDSALLRKMKAVAAKLGARIQGDDGELYTGDEPLDDDDERDALPARPGRGRAERPRGWRRFFGG